MDNKTKFDVFDIIALSGFLRVSGIVCSIADNKSTRIDSIELFRKVDNSSCNLCIMICTTNFNAIVFHLLFYFDSDFDFN